ncbi:MAG: hypothetical protein FRX48_01102 [Lasallia pustulata]|uniref:Suppressor of anucleate metulae protein B n=1 Tax=Lasallia pustulata TaxID=136370 RepID=A0A5M8Q3X2_9LECA|nr:MAG: hypothetical protein FRX48_01102 [Lasallia pustulata]
MPPANYLAERETLTQLLYESPYDPCLYLGRARCYEHLGFPDLAAGDAYRALLLTDEAQDESGEYHEQVLEAFSEARNGGREEGQMNGACNGNGHTNGHEPASGKKRNSENGSDDESEVEGHNSAVQQIAIAYALESYQKLAQNLAHCGCLRSAFDFCQRGSKAFPKASSLNDTRQAILATNRETQLQRDPSWDESSFDPKTDLPDEGSVRRELYPWNTHEPDRFSATTLSALNAELQKAAPKCAVQPISLPLLTSSNPPKTTIQQLGLFATADIPPGDVPRPPPLTPSSHSYACPSCPDTVFCSAPCLALAQTHYHPAICGKDIDAVGKDTPAPDAANALYLLLLFRAVALAETQATHPLDLRETKYLWGGFVHPDRGYLHSASAAAEPLSVARHLPFSFRFNVLAPLHVLEKMDVDVFAPTALRRYDGWVLNTLYAKFRGTASARLNV